MTADEILKRITGFATAYIHRKGYTNSDPEELAGWMLLEVFESDPGPDFVPDDALLEKIASRRFDDSKITTPIPRPQYGWRVHDVKKALRAGESRSLLEEACQRLSLERQAVVADFASGGADPPPASAEGQLLRRAVEQVTDILNTHRPPAPPQ